jgi:hypothetical protein
MVGAKAISPTQNNWRATEKRPRFIAGALLEFDSLILAK